MKQVKEFPSDTYKYNDFYYTDEQREQSLESRRLSKSVNICIVNDVKSKYTKIKREDLYPEDYDMEQLFVDFKTRKIKKDIERGSKKALNEIKKGHMK